MFLQKVEELVECIQTKFHVYKVVIYGNFKINLLESSMHLYFLLAYNFRTIFTPTMVTKYSTTLIDNVFF